MKPINEVIACVVDNGGSYLSLAQRIAKEYKEVFYCNPYWQDPYPLLKKTQIGVGIDGITVVEDIWGIYDQIDLWVFPDCYSGPLIEWLRSQGEIVWGSGVGEELELERDLIKKHQASIGLPVSPWESIQGMDNLRQYLQEHEDVYVKINKWRGTIETFHSVNYRLIQPVLDDMEHNLGPLASQMTFIVESPVPAITETGWDGWVVDDKYPEQMLAGVEVKDKAYVGKIYNYKDLSPLITDFNEKMKPTFKRYGYHGFFSTEIRITQDNTPYMIDATCRVPCPPGQIYEVIYKNLGEIIWNGANGKMVDPIPTAEYGVELLMESEWSINNYQPIYFPPEYSDNIRLKKATKIGDTYYIIPQLYGSNDIGAIVSTGNTLKEAIDSCIAIAKSIEGNDIHIRIDALDDAENEFNKFEQLNKGDKK